MQLLAFDPGETTGIAYIRLDESGRIELVKSKQVTFSDVGLHNYLNTFMVSAYTAPQVKPDMIVYEEFRLYSHKAQSKSWSNLPEVRAQGAIEFFAFLLGIPVMPQSASVGKQGCPDKVLKDLGLWKDLTTHERDAVRHGITYLLRTKKIRSLKWTQK